LYNDFGALIFGAVERVIDPLKEVYATDEMSEATVSFVVAHENLRIQSECRMSAKANIADIADIVFTLELATGCRFAMAGGDMLKRHLTIDTINWHAKLCIELYSDTHSCKRLFDAHLLGANC